MTGSERHSGRATLALRRLGDVDPALAALGLWCRHRDGPDGPVPVRTDGQTIFYGPAFAGLADHEQVGLAAHHILHIAFRHAQRAAGLEGRFGPAFDESLFNLGADALINETLLLAGHGLPRPCVTLTDLLKEALNETVRPEAAVTRYDAEALYVRLMQAPAGRKGRSGAGEGEAPHASASDGARSYALQKSFAQDLDCGRADPDAARNDAVEAADWRQRIARAMEAGRQAGIGVGAIGLRLADLPQARTPWETVLRGMVSKAVAQSPRRTHARPARRWIAADDAARQDGLAAPAFEPATLSQRSVPRVAVGIDASGSVDGTLLRLFAAQIAGIGRRTGAEMHVLVFDYEVTARCVMRGADWERRILDVDFSRDGGTSFIPVMAEAASLDPAAIVILTDLDGPFGPGPGRTPVVWAVPGDPPAQRPPFGRILSLAR